MDEISVLIVDDHTVVRKGIQMIIGTEPGIEVVGEAKDGQDALNKARELKPDVILMDLMMPKVNGIDAIQQIKSEIPDIKILVLTTFEDEENIRAAMEAGADGYQLKDAEGESLLQAVQSVTRDEMPIHSRVTTHLIKMKETAQSTEAGRPLTDREKQVLRLVALGRSNKEVAQELSLSNGTIKVHVSNILNKLNVTSRTEAAVMATKSGLINLEGNKTEPDS